MLGPACPVKLTNRMDEQAWCHTPGIPALRQLGQEGHEFKASLCNIVRPSEQTNLACPVISATDDGPKDQYSSPGLTARLEAREALAECS